MELDRQTIITCLHRQMEVIPAVGAAWLEGSDASGWVDEYSDIDMCVSVAAGMLEEVTEHARAALESLGVLDLIQTLVSQTDMLHTVFHLAGTPEYLLVDFMAYTGRGSDFYAGDEVEKPLVLFDRIGVVRFTTPDEEKVLCQLLDRLEQLKEMVAQSARIEKYVRRGNFLEAFGYYHKWLLTPLIEAIRMVYTPQHSDYYIVHISRHLPPHVLARLENLFKVSSTEEIGEKYRQALTFFEEVAAQLQFGQGLKG
ncbi:MAG TPA: hypothetical protein VIO61_04240 [Anaerolineaceae bacterium]